MVSEGGPGLFQFGLAHMLSSVLREDEVEIELRPPLNFYYLNDLVHCESLYLMLNDVAVSGC